VTVPSGGARAALGSLGGVTAEALPQNELDVHTTAGKLAELRRRNEAALHAGSEAALAKRRELGKQTARERVEAFLDEGSFVEIDALSRHRARDFGLDKNRPTGDGVITGYGTVDGRPVCIFSQDATVFGGALGEVYGEKIVKVMDLALKTGCPIVGLNEGSGARIQEGIMGLALYGDIFYRNVMASGVIPQISLILGNCAGGHVYSPALTDFNLMVDQASAMMITGPDVIKTVTGEDISIEDLGGARAHNSKSGVAHFMSSDEQEALELAKALLSYLPSNNLEQPPVVDAVDALAEEPDLELDTFIPDSNNAPYDMHRVIEHVLDDGEFLEVQELWAQSMVCGFGRVEGRSVGVVGNNPMHFAGTLDIDASEKAARFVRTCDAFNVPILTFCDVPGFLPGVGQEHAGIIRRGAKLLYAYSEATVPLVTVITRKAYGGAYVVMGSKHLGADINLAWPTAQVAVVGAQGAVNIIQRKAIAASDDPERTRAEFIQQYEDTFATPYIAAERGFVDAVIEPSQTRREVAKALRLLATKRQTLPPKKHGNIPL
jgi:propionyl-CoA carboxylase beta chain